MNLMIHDAYDLLLSLNTPFWPLSYNHWRWFFISIVLFPATFIRQRLFPIKWPGRKKRPDPLIDYGAKMLPNTRKWKVVQDIFPALTVAVAENYSKFFQLYGTLIVLRFVCFNATILPPPDKDFPPLRMSLKIIPNFDYGEYNKQGLGLEGVM